MSVYQVYLSEEQKKSLLFYINEMRSKHMSALFMSSFFIITLSPLIISDCSERGLKSLIKNWDGILILIMFVFVFLNELSTGIGKRFGIGCDKWCIKRDDYTIDCMKFGSRQEDKGNHPYYINDTRGVSYICPKFSDYKSADSDTDFLYITLKNGSKYAISAK